LLFFATFHAILLSCRLIFAASLRFDAAIASLFFDYFHFSISYYGITDYAISHCYATLPLFSLLA